MPGQLTHLEIFALGIVAGVMLAIAAQRLVDADPIALSFQRTTNPKGETTR